MYDYHAPPPSFRKDLQESFGPAHLYAEEDAKLQKARDILGDVAKDMSDEDLSVHITQFQYLLECWMDQYERELFNGLTLQELLREG